ncbi:MAG TPA: PQ-loop domain-containing transporter [Stellaceae bacterium]|nr:PQ-loop domain-containing transporter [Stellaceae bacterium]
MADLIGWFAAVILLTTLGRQVYTQWREKSSKGVSGWLFLGQITSSVCFVAYSWMLGSWVFVATNAAILLTAIIGQLIYLRNARG